MSGKGIASLLLIVMIILTCWTNDIIYQLHTTEDIPIISKIIHFPPRLVKALSLEFPGILSDHLMLQTLVFHGDKLLKEEKITDKEWQQTYLAIKQIINLDPKFWDPYVVAETSFPWEAGMVKETNELMLIAAKHRPNDYRPNFFLWYNHFYFLKDPKTASGYLQESARKPGAPSYFSTLASRTNLYANQTKNGILFLREMLKVTRRSDMKRNLQIRHDALMAIAFLEDAIVKFKNKFNMTPPNLDNLVEKGIIKAIPNDPYGGSFYIMKNGRIYTTSKLTKLKK